MRRLAIAGVLLLISQSAQAVIETVIIEKPFHSRSVAGTTVDPSGAVVSGVEIIDCDQQCTHVYATTTSDASGHFSLPRDHRSVHYLALRARGFNPLRITIELRMFSRASVTVKLPIGG